MKHKYIEERFNRWFVFGEHKDANTVDVVDRSGEILFESIDKEKAAKIIIIRNAFINGLIGALGYVDKELEG